MPNNDVAVTAIMARITTKITQDCLDKKIDFEVVRTAYISHKRFHVEVRMSDLHTLPKSVRIRHRHPKLQNSIRSKTLEYILCAMAYYKRLDLQYEIFVENPALRFRRLEDNSPFFFQSVFNGILGDSEESQRHRKIQERRSMRLDLGLPVSEHPSLKSEKWDSDRSAIYPNWLVSEDEIESVTSNSS